MEKGRKRRWFLVMAVLTVVPLAYGTGFVDFLRDPVAIKALAAAHPIVTKLGFLLAYTLVSAFGVPGVVFMVPSPLVFPVHEAFLLSLVGSMTSSWLGFALTRSAFRSFLEPRIPARFRIWDERMAANELRTVIIARLMFFLLPPVSWALALTKVRTGPYLLGTLIGMFPGVWFCVYIGGSFMHWMREQPWWMWAGAALIALAVIAFRRRRAEGDE